MRSYKIILKIMVILLAVTMLFVSAAPLGQANLEKKQSVLILQSYHEGYKWTDDISGGIISVLGACANDFDLHVEYMDTYRISDDEYLQKLYEVYKYKFRNSNFDCIIAADDAAFHFLRNYRDQLFPHAPVVFCGVNYFEDNMLAGQEDFTGVVEGQDIKSTINMALTLHPNTKNIYIINDSTLTGMAIQKTLEESMPEFTDKVNFIPLSNYSMTQIQDKVSSLPADSIVLFLIFFQDITGRQFNYDESISMIAAQSNVPIYGVWDFSLGHGIVGGMLTSGYYQGEMAAKAALRILHGEPAKQIAVVKNSPNHFMFDSQQLKRFNINLASLPEDSILINDSFSGKKQILVLNSYHYGMSWTNGVNDGIQKILSNSNTDLYYEFMDAKRNAGPEYLEKLHQIYKYKFANKHFDAIIAADDDAYNFVHKYHLELFPNIPTVFCGVNYLPETDMTATDYFTGVVETIDIKSTIETALQLHPNTKKIVVINDKTTTGQANKLLMQKAESEFPSLHFTYWEDINMADLQEKVAALSDDTIVLLLSFNKDKSNNMYSYEESIRIIAEKAFVPIYSVWDFYLGHGIVGGKLTTGYSQGELAAKLLQQILDGKSPKSIDIVTKGPNKYMFDYNYLQRFHIKPEQLPKDSIIINDPGSFWEEHQFTILVSLLAAAGILLIAQRIKAQRQLKNYARTDALTGILNRRAGFALAEQHLKQSKNYSTICFVDINDLKIVNDTYGHHEGDYLIKQVCSLLKGRLHQKDLMCRLGGDEFLVMVNGSKEDAKEYWKLVQSDTASFNDTSTKPYSVAMSCGFAQYNPEEQPISLEQLIKIADGAMYSNKQQYKLQRCENHVRLPQ